MGRVDYMYTRLATSQLAHILGNSTIYRHNKNYRHIIKFKFAAPSSQNLLIQRGIATEDLKSIYLLPYQSTTETKLIAFQIKILHNILPTNATLCKMKIKDSDLCPYCTSEKHTLSHLFIECKRVMQFLEKF